MADAETQFKSLSRQLETALDGVKSDRAAHASRLTDIEQMLARRGGGSGGRPFTKSWGQALVESDQFKALAGQSAPNGQARIQLKRADAVSEYKAILGGAGGVGGSGSSLVAPDYRVADPVMLARQALPIRALLMPGQTSANMVYYPRQTVRLNNAASVPEMAVKPLSDMTFQNIAVPVRTLAHIMQMSKQILDDAAALQSVVDAEMRYGLGLVEEHQFLFGDGTGENLTGMIPLATPFDKGASTFTDPSPTGVDILIEAIAQAELAALPASGIILNTVDWLMLRAIKDGVGRYLSNGPFGGDQPRMLWDLPVAATLSMPRNSFLVGSFMQNVQIFDREEVNLLLSTEDGNNFQTNMITARCEERLAMTVKRPQSLIYGTLS